MEIILVEPSLQAVVDKAIELSKEGYTLNSVLLLGWSYELKMSKNTENEVQEDRMAKARAARGKNGNT